MTREQNNIRENEEKMNQIHMREMYNAYEKIDGDWLRLHYKVSLWMVVFAFLVECILGAILVRSELLETTVNMFAWKFVVLPSGINFLCILINTLVMKSENFSQKQKIYVISLSVVAVSFVLFTVHTIFWTTYSIFLGAIMMTIIYASYSLTGTTAVTSLILIVVSELFIKWDTGKVSVFESALRMGDFLISIAILAALSAACMVAIRFERKKNKASIRLQIERMQLQHSLQIDEMTGVFNRKMLHDLLKSIEEEEEYGRYILAMADIDHFKSINDSWGHPFGDKCLIEFAELLKTDEDKATPFRYGGDEFCLLFHDTSMGEAMDICEDIKTKLNRLRFEENPDARLTASFGLSAYTERVDAVRLFVRADRALYEAKRTRNSVRIYSKEEQP